MPPAFATILRPSVLLRLAALAALLLLLVPPANAQEFGGDVPEREELLDRPISRVDIVGLSRLGDREVRVNIRAAPGQPFDPQTVREDIATLYRLGQFRSVTAEASLLPDGTVALTYRVVENVLIAAVQVVGNKVVSDQDLRAVIPLFANAPRDDFLVEQSVRDIRALYRRRGYFLAEVQVDESRLETEGILIFRIIEGPRVRIRAVEFEGNDSIPAKQLAAQVRTKPYIFIVRKGELDEEKLLDDVATLDRFYKDRGFVDVRVDRRVDLSPDNREAKVVFLIAEGRQYRIRNIEVFGAGGLGRRGLEVFAPEQLRAMMAIRRGDVFARNLVERSIRVIEDSYGVMGYVDVRITHTSVRVGEQPEVDLFVGISEGQYAVTGLIQVQGNFLTRDKIVRRETRLQPGRPLDAREIRETELRLRRTRLFGEPIRIAVQAPDARAVALAEASPVEIAEDEAATEAAAEEGGTLLDAQADLLAGLERDVRIEIRERNTGSVGFGVAVGTDSGFFGEVTVRQDNFDIADPPQSFSELITGRAFRGAGQRFQLSIAPGFDVSTFSVGLTEPRLFETDVAGTIGSFLRLRDYDFYDETRLNLNLALSLRLGDLWVVAATARFERVELDDIAGDAPVDVFEAQGPDNLTGLGIRVVRNSLDRPIRPSRGNVVEFSFEQVGAMGGDWTFPVLRGEFTQFFLVDEDFLGRRSTLRLNAQFGYIFDDAPLYERFYLGGRTLRGFEFRTVAPLGFQPNGAPTNDAVGGNWLVFVGAQYEFPIFGELLNGVVFVDSGTVTDEIGFDQYRVSIGAGVRIYVQQFGPVPIALDFAFPVLSEETDDEQLFSFSAEVPF